MRKKYSVRLFNFDPTSGGIKCMWMLYASLLAKGEEVLANAIFENPDEVVGVYPEISQGNELQAGRVVRYLLNKPGVMTQNGVPGPTKFSDSEILFSYSKLFNPEFEDERIMYLPTINLSVFYDKKKKRTKRAVFIGKGQPTMVHPEDCILIDRSVARDQEALNDLLNECEVLFTYDPVSAMTEVARLSGCRIVYLSDVYSKEDYLRYEPGINGMSFGEDTGEKLDILEFRSHYNGLRKAFEDKLDIFINETQRK